MTAATMSPSNPTVSEFRNVAPVDFSRRFEREAFVAALAAARDSFPVDVPILAGARRIDTKETIESLDPCEKSRVVAISASATAEHTDQCVAAARQAYKDWSHTPAEERAAVLLRCAALLTKRRHAFSAVAVYEAGKTWREADADIAEAIDFLEYYAREAMRLGRPRRLQPYLLGETNDLVYSPLGVIGVIGPWNFPLAIPAGMASAAIAAGNTVILKPAEQTPLITWLWVKLMHEAGLPDGVLNYLPGKGEVCGQRLVEHRDVNMVVFTGSREVGLHIVKQAGQTPKGQPFVKRVVTEMGGKNAIIVDASADMDGSVPDVVYSAFGFAGQKCSACSRLILMADMADEYLKRLVEAIESLKIGPADHPGSQLAAVIDEEAANRVRSYIELGRKDAKELHVADLKGLDSKGFFVPPSLFEAKSRDHRLLQEEIFGPVLTVHRVKDFDEALEVANSTEYALTGGVHSRTLSNLARAREEYMAGNLYLNRTITGAIVGRQPFGGFRLSGIGSKAGGPDYLRQFLVARTVTENLMRHGIASLVESGPEQHED